MRELLFDADEVIVDEELHSTIYKEVQSIQGCLQDIADTLEISDSVKFTGYKSIARDIMHEKAEQKKKIDALRDEVHTLQSALKEKEGTIAALEDKNRNLSGIEGLSEETLQVSLQNAEQEIYARKEEIGRQRTEIKIITLGG